MLWGGDISETFVRIAAVCLKPARAPTHPSARPPPNWGGPRAKRFECKAATPKQPPPLGPDSGVPTHPSKEAQLPGPGVGVQLVEWGGAAPREVKKPHEKGNDGQLGGGRD